MVALSGLPITFPPELSFANKVFKGMDELITEMRLTPPDLSSRLKHTFRLPPPEGVQQLHSIIEDLFALVETHVPGFDTRPYREKVRQRRGGWDQPPGT